MTDIPGATASTYTLVSADLGQNIAVKVTATNTAGSANATAAAVGPIAAAVTYGTWNIADKSANITLTNSNLTASGAAAVSSGVRGTSSQISGKFYFEVTSTGSIAASGVGLATAAANLSTVNGNPLLAAFVNVANGTVFMNSGTSVGVMGTALVSGDCVCVAIDFTALKIWFRKNNGNWNNTVGNDPATNTGGFTVAAIFNGVAAFPLVSLASTGLSHTANFGASAFVQAVPSGFTSGWPA